MNNFSVEINDPFETCNDKHHHV